MTRNRRAGVEDRWYRSDGENGGFGTASACGGGPAMSTTTGANTKAFGRKADAQKWLDKQVSDQVTGTWTDPALSAVTFGTMAERWLSTKATRSPKTVAGYR